MTFQEHLKYFLANNCTVKFGMIEDQVIEIIVKNRKGQIITSSENKNLIGVEEVLEDCFEKLMYDGSFIIDDE